nr:TlpA disulfide reductase family protein [uncultured Pedobacter sp.]
MKQTVIFTLSGFLCPIFSGKIFKIILFLFPFLTLSANRLSAQNNRSPLEIAVGQAVPEYLWDKPFKSLSVAQTHQGRNFVPDVLRLRDFKGRLIILDFWATWCGACIANFPKAKKLESLFKDKLSFVLVNNELPEKSEALLTKRLQENNELFHYINADTSLNKLFFKRLIPHYVWIDANGIVVAATGPDEVNEKNISLALKGMVSGITSTPDIDRKLPLFSSSNLPLKNVLKYNLLTKGKVQGLGSGYEWRKDATGKLTVGRVITNLPLLRVYHLLAVERAIKDKKYLDLDRIQYEGKNIRLLRDTFFNYEFSVPGFLSPKLDSLMWADLNTFSPFIVSYEKRSTKCLALEVLDDSKLPLSDPGAIAEIKFEPVYGRKEKSLSIVNAKLSTLIYLIKENGLIAGQVTDATGPERQVSLSLFLPDSIAGINSQLVKYGLQIRDKTAELDYIIIRDQPVAQTF